MLISKEELDWAERYWSTANYISAASIYLKDNFFLERKLSPKDIKDGLFGHWGTCPGINFIYTHLNLIAAKKKQSTMLVVGPGHGFAAVLANQFMDGSLRKYYPDLANTKKGLSKLIKSFCWPGGFPSHINPGVPGAIHEGGELGYALATAFGASFDNPDLLVGVIVGDGEAETGPTAGAWHSNKFLNPKTDGAVLPIIHLNGYKIANPSIYGTMSDHELTALFTGYGYDIKFVTDSHREMLETMEWAYTRIKRIQDDARAGNEIMKPRWPLIILKTKKGWTGVKEENGKPVEGSYRSHQVPLRDAKTNPTSLKLLEEWLLSYNPKLLLKGGKVPDNTLFYIPKLSIGDNPHAIGGKFRKPLVLPNPKKFEMKFKKKGEKLDSATDTLGHYLGNVISSNENNFRIMSPDELESNRLDAVLEATGRRYIWPHSENDDTLTPDGRVMEILSEHTLQGWLQGYTLTGRHGIFPCYEAFLPIVDSMVTQYLKFLKLSLNYKWRKPVPAMNYLLTSVCWRQDHNGFSHQNPGFINVLLSKATEEQLVRVYLPADTNMLLAVTNHCLQSTNRVNLIVSDKQLIRQWQSYDEAVAQCKTGASIWKFASDENPDVVLAASGDYQTQECLATIKLLKKLCPEIKIRFVNVSELNVLGGPDLFPNALTEKKFDELFTNEKHVIFSFHGYPETIKQLLFDRPNTHRFHIYGYIEKGGTTTPFDMLIQNKVSRYHLGRRAIEHAAKTNPKIAAKAKKLIRFFEDKIKEHGKFIKKNDKDPEEINGWTW